MMETGLISSIINLQNLCLLDALENIHLEYLPIDILTCTICVLIPQISFATYSQTNCAVISTHFSSVVMSLHLYLCRNVTHPSSL